MIIQQFKLIYVILIPESMSFLKMSSILLNETSYY